MVGCTTVDRKASIRCAGKPGTSLILVLVRLRQVDLSSRPGVCRETLHQHPTLCIKQEVLGACFFEFVLLYQVHGT